MEPVMTEQYYIIKDSECLSTYDCHFICSNLVVTTEELSPYFDGCPVVVKLTIINGHFPDNSIPSYWLSSTANFQITNLFVDSSHITSISEKAFSANAFKDFQTICISGSSITEIHPNAFFSRHNDDQNIDKTFKLQNNHSESFSIHDYSFLAELRNLQALTINNPSAKQSSNPFLIINFFQYLYFYKLKTLDLSDNFLTLSANDLEIFPNLETLILRNVRLYELPYEAFSISNFNTISVINIQDNYLKSLDKHLLDSFLKNPKFEKFYISGNPWNCGNKYDIDMYYRIYSDKFEEGVLCGDGTPMRSQTVSV